MISLKRFCAMRNLWKESWRPQRCHQLLSLIAELAHARNFSSQLTMKWRHCMLQGAVAFDTQIVLFFSAVVAFEIPDQLCWECD